jgi:hypothetical protein
MGIRILIALGMVLYGLPQHAAAWGISVKRFTFELINDHSEHQAVLQIEQGSTQTKVFYYNEYGDQENASFIHNFQPLEYNYFNPSRVLVAASVYDYAQKSVLISGLKNMRYALTPPAFDNGGSLFYVFSVFFPEPGEEIQFKLIQSNYSRIQDPLQQTLLSHVVGPVAMRLKHVGQEIRQSTSGKSLEVHHYELSLADPVLALLWNQKYDFWYTAETRFPIEQRGVGNENLMNRYVLRAVEQFEKPAPELPSL